MFLVKVLENKSVIRVFGVSLVLAPFINNLFKIGLLTNLPNRWTFAFFWQVFQASATSTQLLSVGGLIVGALMLSGSQKAWRYALFLMGCHIVVQLANFAPAYRASKITVLFLIINVAVFLFIADQLVWKVKAKPNAKKMAETNPLGLLKVALSKDAPLPSRPVPVATTPAPQQTPVPQPFNPPHEKVVELRPKSQPTPATPVKQASRPITSAKSIPVQFEGFGSWAKLSKITSQGIHMRSLAELPFEFGTREIAVQFTSGMNLRIRFSKREGQDFFFEFVDLSKSQVREINAWLKRVA